ncbi:MAG: TolB family protein [Gemmatimonadaceae bacterium]
MRRLSTVRLLCLTIVMCAVARPALAQDTTFRQGVQLSLRYAPGTRPGIVVLPIASETGDSVRAILQRDLDYGDRVTIIPTDLPTVAAAAANHGPTINYPLFARLGAAGLVQVTWASAAIARVAVHNVAQQKIERTQDFAFAGDPNGEGGAAEWRMSIHAMSDELESWITGTRGISATRILYSSGGRIWQIDTDGANATALSGSAMAMSPAWHPRGSHVAYSAMGTTGNWQVILREAGGATRALGSTPGGQNITPVFSPDGNTLVYSHAREAGNDLYAVNPFSADAVRKVTVGRGSDNMSPTFSPDGRQIAFTTNRTGRPEVYISDADGTNAELLTSFGGDQSYNSNPDWSPDGRAIAYQSQVAGRFQVITIGLRDRSPKRLTSDGINEDPSWAPDSRHLVFTSNRTGTPQLFVLDVESGRTRQLTRSPIKVRTGDWSLHLKR